ncbi:MFS transporter [Aquamicrobium sp. LC103]|uniref:MFS transporter n=1 Tax=Aquamicrobium sp. LC103 TaxID=1120658 RepID=UPI00063EB938|nr:MFS transporter [Aquamicrobium sp. LC103]
MPVRTKSQLSVGVVLGVTQTIGYGSLYYAYGVLTRQMADDTGYSLTAIYGFFSLALLASGVAAPFAGRAMDRFNAARVMALGSLVSGALLAIWALAPGKFAFAIFVVLSQMVSVLVLYEAAFVVAARLAPGNARRVITGITLIAGFASTIFWPLTTWLSDFLTWREIYLCYAGLNILVCAPLHLWLQAGGRRIAVARGNGSVAGERKAAALSDERLERKVFLLLLAAFSANAYVISAVHLHLIGLLGALGLGASAALVGALIGPSQVLGRIVEFTAGERLSITSVAIASTAALPVGLAMLMAGAGYLPAALGFAVVFGLGQGLSYIVRGVLPLHVFGAEGYGALMGKFNAARLFVSAGAPMITAVFFERAGAFAALATIMLVALAGVASLAVVPPLLREGKSAGGASSS